MAEPNTDIDTILYTPKDIHLIKDTNVFIENEAAVNFWGDFTIDGVAFSDMPFDNSITQAKMADNSVGTTELIDLNVTEAKLADGAVTNTKLGDASVSNAKLVDLSVNTAKLAADSVTTDKIVNATILNDDLSVVTRQQAGIDRVGIHVTRTTDTAVATGATVDVVWEQVVEELGGEWMNAPSTSITVPADQGGIYLFRSSVGWSASTSTLIGMRMLVNGSSTSPPGGWWPAHGGGGNSSVSSQLRLFGGDVITSIGWNQVSGVSLNMLNCWFYLYKVSN